MKTYIYKNSYTYLLVIFIVSAILDLAQTGAKVSFINNILIHGIIWSIFQLAMMSIGYRDTVKIEGFNYVLSLGKSRQSIWKDTLLAYINPIIIYSALLMIFNLSLSREFLSQYIIIKTLFSFAIIPIFINNIIDSNLLYFILLPVYAWLAQENLILFILVSTIVGIYLILKFRRRILFKNLI